MSFRDELEAAQTKVADLERTLAERDASIAELSASLRSGEIGEPQRIKVRQLETAIAAAREEAAALRARAGRPPAAPQPSDLERERTRERTVRNVGIAIGIALVLGLLRFLLRH